jgi:hypothetical protein
MGSTYEDLVLEAFPDARLLDNEQEDVLADQFWISDGHGNDISDDYDNEYDAWKSAYEKMDKHINKTAGFKGFM